MSVQPASDALDHGEWLPDGRAHVVDTVAAAQQLTRFLSAPERLHPVVVVTVPSDQARPLLDAAQIAGELESVAVVCVLQGRDVSWAFSTAMPPRTTVFGGAGRVYPQADRWREDPWSAPLRCCWRPSESALVAELLVRDALHAATAAGLLAHKATPRPRVAAVVGATVEGLMGDRHALVRLDSGTSAVVVTSVLRPDVPADRLLAKGQRLSGVLAPSRGAFPRLDVSPPDDAPRTRVLGCYPPGSLVVARVRSVGATAAVLLLHPDVPATLPLEEVDPGASGGLSRFVDPGDVLVVRLVSASDAGLVCSLLDVPDDQDPLPAVPVLPGGPAWLLASPPEEAAPPAPSAEPGRVPDKEGAVETAAAEASTPQVASATFARATPASVAGRRRTGAGIEEARHARAAEQERDALATQLRAVTAELTGVKHELATLKRDYRRAKKDYRALENTLRALHSSHTGAGAFSDPERQFRHEVWLAWLHRVPDGQREEHPLGEYRIGSRFLDSVESTGGVDRSKVVEVAVEVLSGLAQRVPGRELHQLRTSRVGPPRVRPSDDAVAWRCNLQTNSPSARRLHFWRLPRGLIELSRVVVHDDVKP